MVSSVPLYTTSLQRNIYRLRTFSEVSTSEDAWLIKHAGHQSETRDVIDWFLVARARYRPTFPFDSYSYRWHYFVLAVSGKTLFIKA